MTDLRTMVGIKAQSEVVKAQQDYENLVLVASQIFGKADRPQESEVEVIQDFAQLQRAFSEIGGTVGG